MFDIESDRKGETMCMFENETRLVFVFTSLRISCIGER